MQLSQTVIYWCFPTEVYLYLPVHCDNAMRFEITLALVCHFIKKELFVQIVGVKTIHYILFVRSSNSRLL